MAVIQLIDLSIGFRGPTLLDDVTCAIEAGQKIGLLGRNGSGKTTLLRILAGEVAPDHGQCVRSPGAKVALLAQDVPRDLAGPVSDVVLSGLPADERDDAHLWQAQQQVERLLSQMNLDGRLEVGTLSSGMKRRVLLARHARFPARRAAVGRADEPPGHRRDPLDGRFSRPLADDADFCDS